MTESRLSIVVVSFNTRELTLACLESVRREARGIAVETIVVDNASADGSAEAVAARFPEVLCLRMEENLGFARAANLGARRARGPLLLLLNPDTVLLEGALASALAAARRHPGEVLGGRAFHADGRPQPASCWGRPTLWSLFCRAVGLSALFPRNRVLDPESLGPWQRDTEREVDIVSGCFLLVPRALWDELGGFDERFFVYGEDADLCFRVQARGGRCRIDPGARFVHHGGASEPVRADKMVRLFRAKAQLFAKHWPRRSARLGVLLLDAWALTRLVALRALVPLRPGAAEHVSTWRSVRERRGEWSLDAVTAGPEAASGEGPRPAAGDPQPRGFTKSSSETSQAAVDAGFRDRGDRRRPSSGR